MSEFFYRLRPLETLLGPSEGYQDGYDELRKQTVFFAAPETLNDPMEGFKDIVWSGDQIIWGNLLNHYLMCLQAVFSLIVVSGDSVEINQEYMPIFSNRDEFFVPPKRDFYKTISDHFFSSTIVESYMHGLTSRTTGVRANELCLHLATLHPIALKAVHDALVTAVGMKPWPQEFFDKSPPPLTIFEHLNRLEKERPDVPDGIEILMAANQNTMMQLKTIGRLQMPIGSVLHKNQLFLISEFTQAYINRLQDLLHPNWYAACFSGKADNPSFWGHYGKGHTGICLKFKGKNIDGRPTLPITMQTGWSGGGGKSEKIFNKVDLELHKIAYSHKHPEIDFFRSIGRLPIPHLNSTWLFSEDKIKSVCHDDMFGTEDKWRASYWEKFYEIITTKADDWSYENEYRLIISPQMVDYSSCESRALEWDFDALDGLIFGIKTPTDKIVAVMQIIQEKCRERNRETFNFYQAGYNKKTGKIDAIPMGLIKFSKPEA